MSEGIVQHDNVESEEARHLRELRSMVEQTKGRENEARKALGDMLGEAQSAILDGGKLEDHMDRINAANDSLKMISTQLYNEQSELELREAAE